MGTPPQVARIPRLTRAKVEDNPRLGGAVFRREVALTTALTPSRGAYFRKEAPSRGTYSAPNPRCGGGISEGRGCAYDGGSLGGKRPHVARIPRLTRAVEAVVSLFLALWRWWFLSFSRALISLSSLNSLSSLISLILRTQRVFLPRKRRTTAHIAHICTQPLCACFCVFVCPSRAFGRTTRAGREAVV